MAELNYSSTVNLQDLTTSHSQAVLLVTPGSTVLDIGAADGSVARPLAARGCRVWGVERDPGAAARAHGACERVIVGDVEAIDLEAQLADRRFDYILCLDVLEHLRDPLAVLTRLRDYLTTGGRVIASIPNVTHGAVRLSLMSGAFRYTEKGLLDSTHLRFFDRAGAEGLFADAGLRIVERLRVARGLTETEIPIDPAAVSSAILQQLREDPDATTYQFILVGVPADGANATALAGASLAERLQRRVEEIEANSRELETYARSLEMQGRDLQGNIEELRSLRAELERRMQELALRHVELRHLQADLAVKEAFIAELRGVRTELERRMEELTQRHGELRHLQADLAVKEACIAELRQTTLSIADREELNLLRAVNSPGFRELAGVARRLSRYPRTYRFLRSVARRVGGTNQT